jgi:hypothetical protein
MTFSDETSKTLDELFKVGGETWSRLYDVIHPNKDDNDACCDDYCNKANEAVNFTAKLVWSISLDDVRNGCATPNEYRKQRSQAPITGGDNLFVVTQTGLEFLS